MNKSQLKKIYKPKYTNHKNGAGITTFQKDNDGNYPLYTEVKKLYPNGFYKFNKYQGVKKWIIYALTILKQVER